MYSEQLKTLKANIDRLGESDQRFARSLLDQLARFGSLSEKQWPFIAKLAERATTPAIGTITAARYPRIVSIFTNALKRSGRDAANDTDKRPTLYLATNNGLRFVAKYNGAGSKNPGHITIASKEFGVAYYGRIDGAGVWFPATQRDAASEQAAKDVESTLDSINADPKGALNVQSNAIGACACCGRTLTDAKSVKLGVGPICAKRWGL